MNTYHITIILPRITKHDFDCGIAGATIWIHKLRLKSKSIKCNLVVRKLLNKCKIINLETPIKEHVAFFDIGDVDCQIKKTISKMAAPMSKNHNNAPPHLFLFIL